MNTTAVENDKSGNKKTILMPVAALTLITLAGFFLRVLQLDHTFVSSDNVMLAERIVKRPGFVWMVLEQYGLMISFFVKIGVSVTAALGITVTEFYWTLPVAIAGTLSIPVVYLFLKRMDVSEPVSIYGAAITSILPVHIFQSRYLWGYEIFGILFATFAVWSLLVFYKNQSRKNAVIASALSGAYIISHGYFAPYAPVLLCIIYLYSPVTDSGFMVRMKEGLKLYFSRYLWAGMAVMLPFTTRPLIHMFAKKTRFGFYLFDHIPGYVYSTGLFLSLLLLPAIILYLFSRRVRSRQASVMLLAGFFFMAPIIFGTPAGITVANGYMLVSAVFFQYFMLMVLDRFVSHRRTVLFSILTVTILLTLWGDYQSIFLREKGMDPSLVRQQRGEIFDPGTKAAGYIVQKYVPASSAMYGMHQSIEEPNIYYYFRRKDYAFDDLTTEATVQKLAELKDRVDVVVCSIDQVKFVEATGLFERKVELTDGTGLYGMYIFTKPGVPVPVITGTFGKYNALFDREFSWNREILSGFFSDGKKSFGQLIEDSCKRPGEKEMIRKKLHFLY